MVPSYDPELRLVYLGTSVTSPAPKFFLGDVDRTYLHHNSTLALEHATGEIRWAYQHLNDHWDLDHVFARLLVDTPVAPDADSVRWINPDLEVGASRKVMTGVPGKTGIVTTLDRETGEFLWATPTIHQNVITDISGSGEVTVNDELIFREVDVEKHVCPSLAGGTEAGAYSPLTNTFYYPLQNVCMQMLATNNFDSARARALGARGGVRQEIYSLLATHEIAPGAENVGTVRAISAQTGETLWLEEFRPRTQSLVATGGGLLFGGDSDGRFRALDQETGETLWEINLGAVVAGYPITYAVEGRQYVAVTTGDGSSSLTPEIQPAKGYGVFVFALPD